MRQHFQYLWDGLQSESLVQQWFGGLVPICDWRDTWLDRGFAHHRAALYTEHRHGRDECLLWYVLADQGTTLADWKQGRREAVAESAPKDLAAFVTGHAPCARAAAVLQMLRQQLGDARWRAPGDPALRSPQRRQADLQRRHSTVGGSSGGPGRCRSSPCGASALRATPSP